MNTTLGCTHVSIWSISVRLGGKLLARYVWVLHWHESQGGRRGTMAFDNPGRGMLSLSGAEKWEKLWFSNNWWVLGRNGIEDEG